MTFKYRNAIFARAPRGVKRFERRHMKLIRRASTGVGRLANFDISELLLLLASCEIWTLQQQQLLFVVSENGVCSR